MSNWVTISTIGSPQGAVSPDTTPEKAVEHMGDYLLSQMNQVLPDRPDLILLTEACDRPAGWGAKPQRLKEYYEVRGDRIRDRLAEVAAANRCYIGYSAIRRVEDGTWRNSTVLLGRDGNIVGAYNKNHVVPDEYEVQGILYGREATVLQCDFGRVGFAICFDLNFDPIRLQYAAARPDVILFSSMYHGGLMQGYWAYSCRSHFVAAVAGQSSGILSPLGEEVARNSNYFDFVTARVNLDCRLIHLDGHFEKLQQMKRQYGPRVKMTDPSYLGAVLLSAETEDVEMGQVMREFDFLPLDGYFARCLEHRAGPGKVER